jgi:hypothetical protein
VVRLAIAGATVPQIATFTGHSLKDVEAILDAHRAVRPSARGRSRDRGRPIPITQKSASIDGRRGFELTVVDPSPLPKEDLLKLYAYTHRHVHRGSLKSLLSSEAPIDQTINMPEIVQWAQKINDLLSSHTIAINSHKVWLCTLRNVDDHDRVEVAIAEAPSWSEQLKI